MAIPKIIHQVWLGGQIPELYQSYAQALRDQNPEFEYHLWRDEGVRGLPNSNLFGLSKSISGRANIARLDLINQFGGIYLDMDVEPVKPLAPLFAPEVTAFAAREDDVIVCSSIFAAEAQHPWVQRMRAKVSEYCRRNPPWGPALMTAMLDASVTLYPTDYFYPYHFKSPPCGPKPETYLIHHWTGSWTREPWYK